MGITLDKAAKLFDEGIAQAVSFGTLYVAHPKLVEDFRDGKHLNGNPNPDYLKQGGELGYNDHSVYQAPTGKKSLNEQ